MKKTLFVATAVLLCSVAAQAQTQSNASDATSVAAATVGGLFVPGNNGGTINVGATSVASITAPTPPVGNSAGPTVTQLMTGDVGARASFTSNLVQANIPQSAATALADAVGKLQVSGGSVTGANLTSAVNAWNAVIAQLSTAQLIALINTPEGAAAVSVLNSAAQAGGVR